MIYRALNENNIRNEIYSEEGNDNKMDNVEESDHNSDTEYDGGSDEDIEGNEVTECPIFLGKDIKSE
ncbi:hypothetical protein FQA39_LY02810 [Lamprigera yunnana]|nr:hypothetical protein FQA39_LY02810 [Lamprigera yunnana]